ncbi:MAG: hypothetical protein QMC80_09090 [Thermoplasmatales archaeon]|nr:hypothetical protein [Thermoplasmatales archaeon]
MRGRKANINIEKRKKAANIGIIIDTNVFFKAPLILSLAERERINVCITKEIYDEIKYKGKDFLIPKNIKILPEQDIEPFFSDKIYDELGRADKSILNACITFPDIDVILSYDKDIIFFNWDLKLLEHFNKKVSIMKPEEFIRRYKFRDKFRGRRVEKWVKIKKNQRGD